MIDYTLEHKASFVLRGYGFPMQDLLADQTRFAAEQKLFENTLHIDGRFDKLKKLAKDTREWSVIAQSHGKTWYYFAVESRKAVTDDTRLIKFPESDYIVVTALGEKEAIFDVLTHQAFEKALPKLKGYIYNDGPCVAYRQERRDGSFYGEFWISVVKK